jgi:DNA-binding MarR family transcriptional regulator
MAVLEIEQSAEFPLLQKHTDLTRGNLSSHLSKLDSAGYITIAKSFIDRVPHTQITLTESGRTAFLNYRQQLQVLFGVPTEEEYNSEIFRRYRERMREMFDQPPGKPDLPASK